MHALLSRRPQWRVDVDARTPSPLLPAAFALGAGGVLLHAGSGRPVPHSCSLNEEGVLVSSTGKALPDSMTIGPNRCA